MLEHGLDRAGFARLMHQRKYAGVAGNVLWPGGTPAHDELSVVNRNGETAMNCGAAA
ncbi:hypothetical protein GCM10022255_085530 [Dactylosporangium darangshiense]|uniref:Uncharacterized protein n=1 Tax=Dactylosporangium darangshiense TaxID=579108 RepID=A0ABP8DMH8_9ACTN